VNEERDLLYKWLKDFCSSPDTSLDEISKFFKEKLIKSSDFLNELTQEGFECFRILFLTIN